MPLSRPAAVSTGVVLTLSLGLTVLGLAPGAAPEAAAAGLSPYASCEELLEHYRGELVRSATAYGVTGGGVAVLEQAGGGRAAAAADSTSSRASGEAVGSGPTGTNLQEHGVDEPDSAKLAGDLLLVVAQGRLQVLRAGPQPQLLSSYELGDQMWGSELLVDGDRVLVVSPTWGGVAPADVASSRLLPGHVGTPRTWLVLLDLSDPGTPRRVGELELDGRYLSARLVDGTVRLVTASTPTVPATVPAEPYGPAQEAEALRANREAAAAAALHEVLPQVVRRDAAGHEVGRGPALGCEQVRRPPDAAGTGTLVVTTLRPSQGLAAVDATGVTTDGDVVYASLDRLYVATSRWGTTVPEAEPADAATRPVDPAVTTELHAFDTSAAAGTRYLGSGQVDGYVLGRWALSAYDGHLRVATTLRGGSPESSSTVTVLAERGGALRPMGRVDGLGPGERIYAVRWSGPLGFVVTFRETDPLYVLDLARPEAPRVLGELKVPGFSTYLHPVGDDRLLGVGQEADERGRVTGMQVSLFDLADLSRPVQLDRLQLGEGWSAALDDSRAFGYDPVRRLALLPYGDWSGRPGGAAVGVRVGADGRLSEAGRLAVASPGPPHRVLHGDGVVYAVADTGVVAGRADDLARTGAVPFPVR